MRFPLWYSLRFWRIECDCEIQTAKKQPARQEDAFLNQTNLYRDIAERTGGDIYIGVVGPVRSGKSTFIRRFMETVVIPNIPNEFERSRARDEMPQSAGGRTVMTTEPKFVPDEAVKVQVGENMECRIKMVDCVGYLIPEVLGTNENGETRMVHTPWSPTPIPFEEAAELGTKKVITEHATIGMLVTSDGTVGDIPRDNYIGAEERIAGELKEIGKPFAVILNSSAPESEKAVRLAITLEEKYGVPVALVNCMELNSEDISHILEMIVMEFPLRELTVKFPVWTTVLDKAHPLLTEITENIKEAAAYMTNLHSVNAESCHMLEENTAKTVSAYVTDTEDIRVEIEKIAPGSGCVTMRMSLPDSLYYCLLSEVTGIPMKDETELLSALRSLADVKREYDKFAEAIRDVKTKGYGIVMPEISDLTLDEPELIKQSGGYGVRLKASAPSVHMIQTMVETEVNPLIGSEQQSTELIEFLKREFTEKPDQIWETNMFGRTLYELVNDGMNTKIAHMPEDARGKFGETLSKIINEGSSGLICIIL